MVVDALDEFAELMALINSVTAAVLLTPGSWTRSSADAVLERKRAQNRQQKSQVVPLT